MATVKLVQDADASPEVLAVFSDIRQNARNRFHQQFLAGARSGPRQSEKRLGRDQIDDGCLAPLT